MESSQESDAVSEENSVSSSAIEPLLSMAIGASEEVNTTANSKENAEKNSYSLRNKATVSNSKPSTTSSEEFSHTTPLNSPIVSCSSTSQTQTATVVGQQNVNELQVQVVPATEVDENPVFCGENLQIVQVQGDRSVSNGACENAEVTTPIPGGFVMIEQSVLEQISGFLKHAAALPGNSVAKEANQVTQTSNITSKGVQAELPNSTTNGRIQVDSKTDTDMSHQQLIPSEEDEWIDTKATALQLMEELRRYHIPQAVFARKVLNRSQGTLSDLLRKPKPWNEMRLGKEIFRKMKQWLSLPEVKRIPQLRTEGKKTKKTKGSRS